MTTVKIDFYKDTGKWYTSFGFNSSFHCFETDKLIQRAEKDERFIKNMSFTITAIMGDSINNRLIIKQP